MGWGEERGWQEVVNKVLGEEGEGESWLTKIEERREGRWREEDRTEG